MCMVCVRCDTKCKQVDLYGADDLACILVCQVCQGKRYRKTPAEQALQLLWIDCIFGWIVCRSLILLEDVIWCTFESSRQQRAFGGCQGKYEGSFSGINLLVYTSSASSHEQQERWKSSLSRRKIQDRLRLNASRTSNPRMCRQWLTTKASHLQAADVRQDRKPSTTITVFDESIISPSHGEASAGSTISPWALFRGHCRRRDPLARHLVLLA